MLIYRPPRGVPSRQRRAIDEPELMPWSRFFLRPVQRLVWQFILPRFAGRRRLRNLSDVRRVAVVHWDNLGDAVHLGPVLRSVRAGLPGAEILLVHSEATTGVFQYCPYVDRLVGMRVQGGPLGDDPHGGTSSARQRVLETARILRHEARNGNGFDLVIGPDWLDPVYGTDFFRNALFRAAGGPSLLRARHRSGLPTQVELRQHHVLRNLGVIAALGFRIEGDHLEFWGGNDDMEQACALLGDRKDGRLMVALGVGAGTAWRRWPTDRYAELARRLISECSARVVLVGGVDARRAADGIVGSVDVLDLVGRTSVGVMAEVVRLADVFIGNDSGPVHIAAATGTPSIVVSPVAQDGAEWVMNSPRRYHPWGVPHVVLQPPERVGDCRTQLTCLADEPHCILGLTVADVMKSLRVLQASRDGSDVE